MPEITSSYQTATFEEVLDDLCVRFIFNLPEEELTSRERVCFQIEEAHWFYEDFVREQSPIFQSLNLRAFLAKIFQHCPLLQKWGMFEDAYAEFMTYKKRVPIRGAILLNEDLTRCLLVKGWKQSASWSFPRGKINKDEPDDICAIREVREETGYDCSDLLDPTQFILHENLGNNHMKLYVVAGVSEDYPFEPLSRKEISKISWVDLEEMPLFSKKKTANTSGNFSLGRLFMVTPFMPALRKWVQRQKKIRTTKTQKKRHLIVHDETEPETSAVEQSPPRIVQPQAILQRSTDVDTLKHMLGVQTEQPATQDDASARLRNLLNVGPSQSSDPPTPSSQGVDLLAILRGNAPAPAAQVVDLKEQPFQHQIPTNYGQPLQAHNSYNGQAIPQQHNFNGQVPMQVRQQPHSNGQKGPVQSRSKPRPTSPPVQQPIQILRRPQPNTTQSAALLSILKAPSTALPEQPRPSQPVVFNARNIPSQLSTPTPYNTVSNDQGLSGPSILFNTATNIPNSTQELPAQFNLVSSYEQPVSPTPFNTLDVYAKPQLEKRTAIRPDSFIPPPPRQQNAAHAVSLLQILKSAAPPPPADPPVMAQTYSSQEAVMAAAAATSPKLVRSPLLSPMNTQRSVSPMPVQQSPGLSPTPLQNGLAEATMTSQSADKPIVVKPSDKQVHIASLLATLQMAAPELHAPTFSPISPHTNIRQGTPTMFQPTPLSTTPRFFPGALSPPPAYIAAAQKPPASVGLSSAIPSFDRPSFDRRDKVKNNDAETLLGLFKQFPGTVTSQHVPDRTVEAEQLLNMFKQSTAGNPEKRNLSPLVTANKPLPIQVATSAVSNNTAGAGPGTGPGTRKRSSIAPEKSLFIMDYLDQYTKKYGQ